MANCSVFFQYGNVVRGIAAVKSRNIPVDEPTNAVIWTNIDLVAAAGSNKVVKHVSIVVHCLANPLPGLSKVIERMCNSAVVWNQVENLAISIIPDSCYLRTCNINLVDYEYDISEVSSALTSLMPGLGRVAVSSMVSNYPITGLLYRRLIELCADQLLTFSTNAPVLVPHDFQFKRVKNAYIDYDRVSEHRLPRMNAAELEILVLRNGPANHSWASFGTCNSQVIEFTKLTFLDVVYHTVYEDDGVEIYHRDGHPWKLQFPSLTNLTISCSKDICPLLGYMELPPHITSVYLDLNSAAYGNFAGTSMPAVSRLLLKINRNSGGNPCGFPAINRMIGGAKEGCDIALEIEDTSLPLLPGNITCTTLTRLQVVGPTSVDTVLKLIQQLPRATVMTFGQLALGDIQSDISVPEAGDHAAVGPFATKLGCLEINFAVGQYSPDLAIAVAKYLLLKVPTLRRYFVSPAPRQPVVDFAATLAPWYPHLGNVELSITEDQVHR